jgi:hypothetical protein
MSSREIIDKDDQLARFSMAQPLGRFCYLWLITLGLYGLHWHYMNWRSFKEGRLSAALAAVFSGFTIYPLSKRVFRLAREQDVAARVEPGLIWISCLIGNMIGFKAPGFWFLLGLPLVLIPTLYVQRTINGYWIRLAPERVQREFFSGGLVAWSTAGLVLWVLTIIGVLDEIVALN